MYNQSIIDSIEDDHYKSIGEEYFKSILDGKIPYTLSIDNLNSKEQQKYCAFQHYLVKTALSGKYRSECIKYLSLMYNDFRNKPYLFCDSPIIKNNFLNSFVDNVNYRNNIINYRNKYYDVNIAKQLYARQLSGNLNDEEKNQLYAYLIHYLEGIKDYKALYKDTILNDAIKNIINSDFNKLNDMQLKFYCQYVSRFALRESDYKTIVQIGTDRSSLGGYELNDYIFINKNSSLNRLMQSLTKTVCHESRHVKQYHESINSNSREAFEYAQFSLFCKYLSTETYDSYHTNYNFSSIEIDAENLGHWNAILFFDIFGRKDLSEKVRNNRIETTDKRNYYNEMFDENKRRVQTDIFIVENMDKIIKNHPKELENYPALKEVYNKDGSKKSFDVLLKLKANDPYGMYDNYINYGILNNSMNNLILNNDDDIKQYLSGIKLSFRDQITDLYDYFNDNKIQKKYSDKRVLSTIDYKLHLCYNMLVYFNSNYDHFLNVTTKGENPTSDINNPIYEFVYRLRDFDINKIKNEKVKNNPKIIDRIKLMTNEGNKLINKFDRSYVEYELRGLPNKILNSTLNIKGYGKMPFESYFKDVIVPRLKGHTHLILNGKEYSVSSLIRECIELAKKNIINTYDNNSAQTKSR